MGTLDHSQNYYFSTPFFTVSCNAGDPVGLEKVSIVFATDDTSLVMCDDDTSNPCDGTSDSWSVNDVNPLDYGITSEGEFTLGLWVLNDNGETTRVATQNVNWAESLPPKQEAKFDIIDPACSKSTWCNGDYLEERERDNIVLVTSDVDKLAEAAVQRTGFVADGVTRLLLRVQTDTKVKFQLFSTNDELFRGDSNSCRFGTLLNLAETTTSCSSLEIEPVSTLAGNFAFALLKAPMHYPFDPVDASIANIDSRIKVKIFSEDQVKEEAILSVHPAPTILLHGLWSNADRMLPLERYLEGSGVEICGACRPTHGGQRAEEIDPYKASESTVGMLRDVIEISLDDFRDHDIAVTRTTIVGHSVGGLIARARIHWMDNRQSDDREKGSRQFKHIGNYNQGDIYKIISLETPHFGTILANWLYYHRSDKMEWLAVLFGPDYIQLGDRIQHVFARMGRPINAIYNLMLNSQALINIKDSEVLSHSIVAIAPDYSTTENNLNLLFKWSNNDRITIDYLLGGNGNHDTIVTRQSQAGALGIGQVTVFNNLLHTVIGGRGIPSPEIHKRVFELLVSREEADFGQFPALNITPDKVALNEALAADNENEKEAVLREAYPNRLSESAPEVTLSPAAGTVITAGSAVTINFSIKNGTPVEGVDGVMFIVGQSVETISGTGPYKLSFQVPSELGRLDVYAMAYGSDPGSNAASSYLTVVPGEKLERIIPRPNRAWLDRLNVPFSLRMEGEFVSGTVYDITASETGTGYELQPGSEDIISVTPEGEVTPLRPGDGFINVSNDGISAVVQITVQLSRIFDTDQDGINDFDEYSDGLDPNNPDSDNDGMPDGWEVDNGLDPLTNDSSGDADNDGFSNLDEYNAGTDPQDASSMPIKCATTVPNNFTTIQSAADYVAITDFGGNVCVQPGTYVEPHLRVDDGVYLVALSNDPAETIIDGGGQEDVITFRGVRVGGVIGFTQHHQT
ncbi:MAG: hypothetical protein D3903_14545, partial [Candidatus Electrothrix sp. GM3_4]|nr:hypothetical protein [Candidatus Electrothrix sp. GM3_4]